MKSSKKAQGLSINIIVIAVIVLIVLVILIMVFTGKIGGFRDGLEQAEGGICSLKADHRCVSAEDCPSFNRVGNVGTYSDCSSNDDNVEYCCNVA